MRTFGLTGGIGTGKSVVSGLIDRTGIPVVNADLIAREVAEPGTECYTEIVSHFGNRIVAEDGRIDRRTLGTIVFPDPARRAELEAITLPRIRSGIEEALAKLASRGYKAAFVEAALIHENRRAGQFEAVVCVHCDHATQLKRIVSRDGISAEEAMSRIAAQMALEEKARMSDYVIDNSGRLEETERQVVDLLSRLKLFP